MHNRAFLSSLPGLSIVHITNDPALKRWAIVTAAPQALSARMFLAHFLEDWSQRAVLSEIGINLPIPCGLLALANE